VNTFMDRLLVGLDDDERVVFPRMYVDNARLYDKITGRAFLVKSEDHDSGLDWVWESSLPRIKNKEDVLVLAEVYIVRIKLPWFSEGEWLCSKEEYEEERERLELVDVFLRVRRKDDPIIIPMIDPLEFETNRDKYDVLEIRYLVRQKSPIEPQDRFLDISGDRFHRIMAE